MLQKLARQKSWAGAHHCRPAGGGCATAATSRATCIATVALNSPRYKHQLPQIWPIFACCCQAEPLLQRASRCVPLLRAQLAAWGRDAIAFYADCMMSELVRQLCC